MKKLLLLTVALGISYTHTSYAQSDKELVNFFEKAPYSRATLSCIWPAHTEQLTMIASGDLTTITCLNNDDEIGLSMKDLCNFCAQRQPSENEHLQLSFMDNNGTTFAHTCP